jgi:hypothetical protein
MKTVRIVILLLVISTSLRAMIYCDSRVLSLSEMRALGIQIETTELPGPSTVRRIAVTVSVFPAAKGNKFLSMSCSVLGKAIADDFASSDARKSGVRDSKQWAKEIRGESAQKPIFTFYVAPDELPNSYLVVRLHLPRQNGIGAMGMYYFLLRDLKKEDR